MNIFVIMIAPEACNSFLHPKAYKTLEDARNAIRDEYGAPREKLLNTFRDNDYTYYYIDVLTLKEEETTE